MIYYIIMAAFCICAIEIFIRFDALVFIGKVQQKISRFIWLMSATNVSDHWKERVVPIYAFIILLNTLKLAGLLALIACIFLCIHIVFVDFYQFSFSAYGFFWSFFFSSAYIKLMKRKGM